MEVFLKNMATVCVAMSRLIGQLALELQKQRLRVNGPCGLVVKALAQIVRHGFESHLVPIMLSKFQMLRE